jgi:hypothetical protein
VLYRSTFLLIFSISYAVRQVTLLSYIAINSFLQAGQMKSMAGFLPHRLQTFPNFSEINGFMKCCFAFVVRNTYRRGYSVTGKTSCVSGTGNYFLQFLFCSRINISRAIIMDGASGRGACKSSRRPASITALAVAVPKDPILISFC